MWLTVFRTVATTLLLATAAVAAVLALRPLEEPSRADSPLVRGASRAVYASTLVYGLLLRRREPRAGSTAYAQVCGRHRARVVSRLPDRRRRVALHLHLLARGDRGAILLFQRGALIAAAVSSVVLRAPGPARSRAGDRAPLEASPLSTARLVFVVVSNALAQFLIAVLASYLVAPDLARPAGDSSSARRTSGGSAAPPPADPRVHAVGADHLRSPTGEVAFVNPAARRSSASPSGFAGATRRAHSRRARAWARTSAAQSCTVSTTPRPPNARAHRHCAAQPARWPLLIVFQDLTELRRTERGPQAHRPPRRARAALGAARPRDSQPARLDARVGADARATKRSATRPRRGSPRSSCASRTGSPPWWRTSSSSRGRRRRPCAPCALDAADRRDGRDAARRSARRGIAVRSDAVEPIEASIDPDQLRQVLINLIRNALALRWRRAARCRSTLAARAQCGIRDRDLGLGREHSRLRTWTGSSSRSSPRRRAEPGSACRPRTRSFARTAA